MFRFSRIGLVLGVVALAIASFTSCSKSDFVGPTLINDPINLKRSFTVNPGESVSLTSKFDVPESLTFEWSIDGVKMADSKSTYTFSTTDPGSYIITEKISNSNGEVFIDYYVTVRGKTYDQGYFLLNNNTSEASLTFISKDYSTTDENAYATVNPGKTLGSNIVSAQAYLGKIYIISETEGLIVLNSITLKEVARIALPAKPNYFLGIDRATALLSTDDGIYRINLNPLKVGDKIPGIGGRCGLMATTTSYIQVLTLESKIIAIDRNKLIVSKLLNVGRSGLATDLSGNVWSSKDTLYSINSSLYVTKYKMPTGFLVTSSWNPWNEGSLCISQTENALFFIRANSDGRPSQEIYKVSLSTITNTSTTAFITLPAGRAFSGVGIRINSENNIVASTVSSTGDSPEVVVYRAGDGTPVKTIKTTSKEAKSMLFNNVK
nr:DUF5074 domain-containing protein [uncultured Acetobacteroides sp.]